MTKPALDASSFDNTDTSSGAGTASLVGGAQSPSEQPGLKVSGSRAGSWLSRALFGALGAVMGAVGGAVAGPGCAMGRTN